MQDKDKSAVYNAETQFRSLLTTPGVALDIAGSTIIIPSERKFGRVEDIEPYVKKVLKYLGHSEPCFVRERKGHTLAMYHGATRTMAIPDNVWALRESVVLHELAHHIDRLGSGHGRTFRSTFTDIVEQVMGPEARFLLQHEYFTRGLSG